jgi:hypothetical protein
MRSTNPSMLGSPHSRPSSSRYNPPSTLPLNTTTNDRSSTMSNVAQAYKSPKSRTTTIMVAIILCSLVAWLVVSTSSPVSGAGDGMGMGMGSRSVTEENVSREGGGTMHEVEVVLFAVQTLRVCGSCLVAPPLAHTRGSGHMRCEERQ